MCCQIGFGLECARPDAAQIDKYAAVIDQDALQCRQEANRQKGNDMDILNKLREELQVERWQVEAAVKLTTRATRFPLFPDTVRKRPVP